MVSDIWVYRRAGWLIARHGEEALDEVNWLIALAVDREDAHRALLMFRLRLAVATLQTPPSRALH